MSPPEITGIFVNIKKMPEALVEGIGQAGEDLPD
jgi:hypothetical protein